MKRELESAAANSSAKGGFAIGKIIALLITAGVVGGGVFGTKYLLDREEEKDIGNKYFTAKKDDFLVTVKLKGTLVSTDTKILKSELEGSTTILSIIDEGTKVEGNSHYQIKKSDTLESIAKKNVDAQGFGKDKWNIRHLNRDQDIDWDNLKEGTSIELPGALLVELDPLRLKERINTQEIAIERVRNNLSRSEGELNIQRLSSEQALKVAKNALQNAQLDLNKTINSTIKIYIKGLRGSIANSEKDVALAEKNLNAYTELAKLGFVSDVEVLKQESSRDKARHAIEMFKADLEAYNLYDKVSLLSLKELAVEEAIVNIKKTSVKNEADLRDANSTISTTQKTLKLEIEKLDDLKEQMANTRIYAPEKGTVVYYSESHRYGRSEPIKNGARVDRGRKLIKLPKTKSLKVDLSVPQASRDLLNRGQKAWVKVNDVLLPGTLSFLSTTVDTNRRGHTDKTYLKGEVRIDTEDFPDSVSEGMSATVEIKVVNLVDDQQLIKLPTQCVTAKMINDTAQPGCLVLNPDTGEHEWRPVTFKYSNENYIAVDKAIRENGKLVSGLEEGELVYLSPLSEAKNLNLEEAIVDKGSLPLPEADLEKKADPPAAPKDVKELLGLDEAQKTKWKAAEDKAKKAGEDLRSKVANGEIPAEKAGAAGFKVIQDFNKDVKEFLSPAQFKKFGEWQKSQSQKPPGR